MKSKISVRLSLLVLAACTWALAASPAWANLCGIDPSSSERTEARNLESENFSAGNDCSDWETCFVGTRSYNEHVIACNRKRDSLGNAVGDVANRTLADDLDARFIRGQFNYFGLFSKRYGYRLKRSNGVWTITVALDFKFPKAESDKLHIPHALTEILSSQEGGQPLDQGVCATDATDKNDNGLVYAKDTPFSARACRVNRGARFFLLTPEERTAQGITETDFWNESFRGRRLASTDWLMHYWRDRIETRWSRADGSLKMNVHIANFVGQSGEVTAATLDNFDKAGTRYKVEMHHNEDRWNNMYRPVKVLGVKVYKAIYTGISEWTILHEFSHFLGLDDEYPQGANPPDFRDCDELSGEDSDTNLRYLMCTVGDEAVKSVYPWIVTRRYHVGYCDTDGDCASNEFCDKGVALGVGRNHCSKKRTNGTACTRPLQCLSGICPGGACAECNSDDDCNNNQYCNKGTLGIGKNKCENKKSNGVACTRPNQCTSGICPGGACAECNSDDDCTNSEFCNTGTLGIGRNKCQALKANGVACTRPDQCQSGICPGGACAECNSDDDCNSSEYCNTGTLGIGKNKCEALKANGVACTRADQCQSGICPGGACAECNSDDDCDSNEYCNTGTVGIGKNKCERKKSNGTGCTRAGQCTSGICPGGACAECKNDSDCDSNEYCNTGTVGIGKNKCEREKSNGTSCSRGGQCSSNCCKLFNFKVQCRPTDKCN
ncbi:MAG: hypothetical protein K0U98_00515 [Deltaproteobacteria bacterium]|nr:hypothetical protein [Deltaproteobacteria bacterium]